MEEIAFFAGGMCNNEESNEPDDSSKDSEFAKKETLRIAPSCSLTNTELCSMTHFT